MKKLLFAALALLFAACTTDLTRDVVITPTNTLTIGVENNDTRIELLDGRTVWSTGDFVSVYYNSNANQKWQFTGQTGDRLGTLEYVSAPWETKSFDDIIIAYPYSEDYRLITATGAIEATLPDVQNYSPESYGLGSSMMVCVGTKPEETFLLKSVCGWLKLQLTGNGNCVEKIVLYGNNKEQVAGSIYVNPADATAILAAQGAEDAGDNTVGGVLIMDDKIYREVTLYCPTGGVQLSDKATDFYIALPPQTFSQGFTVNAHCTNGEVIPLSTNKPTTIERNTILPMAAINCGYNWIDVGVCTYTEDLFNSWFGFSIPPLNVKVQVRADSIDKDAFAAALAGTGSDEGLAGIYRMVNPYDEIKGIIDGLYVYDANIEIHALDIYQVDIPHQEIGVNLDTGGVVAPATIISVTPGTIKNGILSFEEKSLAGIPGGIYTDVYTCNYNAKWSLNIAPELNIYELPVGNDTKDFRFEPVELSENTLFYSQALKKSWKATLEKGYPITPDANKDKRFAEQYGTLYRLPNLYAEGYHIYFCIKDGVGVIPYQYRKQKCGIVYSYDSDYIMLYDEDQRTNISFDEANNRLIFNDVRYHYGHGIGGYVLEVLSDIAPYFKVYNEFDYNTQFEFSPLFSSTLSSSIGGGRAVTISKGTGVDSDIIHTFNIRYSAVYRIESMYTDGYDLVFVKTLAGKYTSDRQAVGTIEGIECYAQVIDGNMDNEFDSYITLQFSDGDGNMLGTFKESFSQSMNWKDVATGIYTAPIFRNGTREHTLQHAEGTDRYRVVNFFGYGSNLLFKWNRESNKCEFIGATDIGYPDPQVLVFDVRYFFDNNGYPGITWEYIEQASNYVQPHFDPATLTFHFELIYSYYDSVDVYQDTFQLYAMPTE